MALVGFGLLDSSLIIKGCNMFGNVESVLKWAYLVSTLDNVDGPSINRMYGKPNPTTRNQLLAGISREDQIKQAINIIGVVNDLKKIDPAYNEIIAAEFGYQRNDKQMENLMMRVISAMGSGAHRRRGIRDIVLIYFGENIGIRKIREDLGCNTNNVRRYKTTVFDALDKIRSRAIGDLHCKFTEKGLISDRKLIYA